MNIKHNWFKAKSSIVYNIMLPYNLAENWALCLHILNDILILDEQWTNKYSE